MMRDRIDATGHSANDHHAPRGNLTTEALGHLRAVEGRPARSHDAATRQCQRLHVAADVEQHRRIIDLQQRLRIFRLGPVQQAAAVDALRGGEFLLGALELVDRLRHRCRQIKALQMRQRRPEQFVGRAKLLQQARGQAGG
jgi:hypothetical protein